MKVKGGSEGNAKGIINYISSSRYSQNQRQNSAAPGHIWKGWREARDGDLDIQVTKR